MVKELEEENVYKYLMTKQNLIAQITQTKYSDIIPIERRYMAPTSPGVIVHWNPVLNRLGASFTFNIRSRLNQLLSEPNTKDISQFFYSRIYDYNQRLDCRFNLRTFIKLRNHETLNGTPLLVV